MDNTTMDEHAPTKFGELLTEFESEFDNFEHRPQRGITIVELREFIGEDFGDNNGVSYKVWKFRAYFYRLAYSVKQFHSKKGNGTRGILKLTGNQFESIGKATKESGIKDLPFIVAIYRYGAINRAFYISAIITEEEAREFRDMRELAIIDCIPRFKQKQEQLKKRRAYEVRKAKRKELIKKYFDERALPLTIHLYKFLDKKIEGEIADKKIEEVPDKECYRKHDEYRSTTEAKIDVSGYLIEDFELVE